MLKFLLIILAAILLGIFVNYYRKHYLTCAECLKIKKSKTWDNLKNTEKDETNMVNDFFDDDDDEN
jgi:hypothetical protein